MRDMSDNVHFQTRPETAITINIWFYSHLIVFLNVETFLVTCTYLCLRLLHVRNFVRDSFFFSPAFSLSLCFFLSLCPSLSLSICLPLTLLLFLSFSLSNCIFVYILFCLTSCVFVYVQLQRVYNVQPLQQLKILNDYIRITIFYQDLGNLQY